jgi:hypothetical protein
MGYPRLHTEHRPVPACAIPRGTQSSLPVAPPRHSVASVVPHHPDRRSCQRRTASSDQYRGLIERPSFAALAHNHPSASTAVSLTEKAVPAIDQMQPAAEGDSRPFSRPLRFTKVDLPMPAGMQWHLNTIWMVWPSCSSLKDFVNKVADEWR